MHRHSRKVDEHYLKSLELLFFGTYTTYLDFLGGSAVKNLPAAQEMWVPSLGWEDALEEGMATHSSIIAWRIPVDRGAWRVTYRVTKSWPKLSDLVHTHITYLEVGS